MAKIRYQPDIKGTNELMRSDGVRDHLRGLAERAKEVAVEISPVRTGDYKSKFRVETSDSGGVHGDRAAAYLINDSEHAADVEWVDGFHVLARAIGVVEG
jgi:hypothetical protein